MGSNPSHYSGVALPSAAVPDRASVVSPRQKATASLREVPGTKGRGYGQEFGWESESESTHYIKVLTIISPTTAPQGSVNRG